VNLVEFEEEEVILESTYDVYNDEEEDFDICPVEGESLVVRRVMQHREWRRQIGGSIISSEHKFFVVRGCMLFSMGVAVRTLFPKRQPRS
jgi:hypothetical protein